VRLSNAATSTIGMRAGRNENRNERWYQDQFREGHNRRAGAMAWRKHIRARHVRRKWRGILNVWAVSFATHALRQQEEWT
jgi:hypothetical protein